MVHRLTAPGGSLTRPRQLSSGPAPAIPPLLLGRHGHPTSCPPPQRVPRLPVCRPPRHGSVRHARTRVHPSLAARQCPAGALRSAASVARAFQQRSSLLQPALIAFDSAPMQSPPEQPQPRRLPVTQHQPAGPAAVQRPALTAQGWRGWGSPRWRWRVGSREKWLYISYTLNNELNETAG